MRGEGLHGFSQAEEARALFFAELDMAADKAAAEAEAAGRSPHLYVMLTTLHEPGDLDDSLVGHLRRLTAVYAERTGEVDEDVEGAVGVELDVWDAFEDDEDDAELPAEWRAAVQDYLLLAERESVERDAKDPEVLEAILKQALSGKAGGDSDDDWEVPVDEFPEGF